MSLTRSLFNEFRPLFRLFDDVSRTYPSYSLNRHFDRHLDHVGFPYSRRPTVDLSEHGSEYVVEAELPGVKKEDLEVRVGDQGRSLTIEGRIHTRSSQSDPAQPAPSNFDTTVTQDTARKDVVQTRVDDATPISSEREFVGSSHFTRTVWLPRPVDSSKVTGNLEDGILTLRIPKASDQGSVKVDIQ